MTNFNHDSNHNGKVDQAEDSDALGGTPAAEYVQGGSTPSFSSVSVTNAPADADDVVRQQELSGDITPASATTATKPVIDVTHTDYGAVGDGTVDDTQAIKDAIAEAASNANGGVIYFPEPPSNYLVTSQILIQSDNITLRGAGGESTPMQYDVGTKLAPIWFSNTAGSELAINTSSKGDLSVTTSTAADAGNFAAGDLVLIGSDDSFRRSSSPRGETAVVESVDSTNGTVSLRWALYDDYSTNPTIQQLNAVENVRVEGLGVHLPGGADYYGVGADGAKNITIENCFITGTGDAAIPIFNSTNVTVRGSRFNDIYYSGTGTSYGVGLFDATTNVLVEDCHFTNLRHGVTFGGTSAKGVPRNAVIRDNFGSSHHSDGTIPFDTHDICEYVSFVDNVAHNGGFTVRGQNVEIRGNEIHGGNISVGIRNTTEGTKILDNTMYVGGDFGVWTNSDLALLDCQIRGNEIIGGAQNGIRVSTAAQHTEISGNKITSPDSNAISFRDIGTVPSGVTREQVRVSENTITDGGGEGVFFGAAYDRCIVSDNIAQVSGTAYNTAALTNSVVTDNIS